MMDEFKVIIDGISLEFFTDLSWAYEWIVDAHRNDNDFMIIANPVRKLKVTLRANKVTKEQFRLLAQTVGVPDIRHSVVLYDDLTESLKTYAMYNSTLTGGKRNISGKVYYEGVSFSLIER